ncbi:hypothetical protein RA307_03900 [Xanthobacteraceae bacterium Astr-EGSB]|uniref:hypothetical protein n=1 Tax=Astrobacterium formosum TaxID=3069710 RepID=UPI0027B45173|nr:hypothetical protein [Xanthobacteraceae bacterium Astr-EGSB]
MKLGEIIRASLSSVDTIGVKRTAANPALWIVGLISPLTLILALIAGDGAARTVFFTFAGCPVLFFFVVYIFWMIRDPDRLQSEEYRIRVQELKLRYRKGREPVVIETAAEIARIEQDHGRGQ